MPKMGWLAHLPGDGAYSLRDAQSDLLQVLLSDFLLTREEHGGVTLKVSFTKHDSALRRREAKSHVKALMPGFRPERIVELQQRIEGVFFHGEDRYSHTDAGFAFRYASGGTLPILEIGSREYYCLFYRDVFPVGWNIANGSCDSLAELLNPKLAIERELREELIILALHPDPPLDFVFTWPGEAPVMPAEYDDSRRLANSFLVGGLDICHFKRTPLEVVWEPPGPDTLLLEYNAKPKVQKGFYLNINATDFGIEVDRIAKIRLPPGFTLLDGEINENRLLNRPIGLFEVGKTKQMVRDGVTAFLPDLLFYSLARDLNRPPDSLKHFEDEVISKFLTYLLDLGARTQEDFQERKTIPLDGRFDLCPVTRSIIRRHGQVTRPRIFMSYGRADRPFAERLERDLTSRGVEVWRDAKDMRSGDRIDDSIEQAIRSSSQLLLLASRLSVSSEFVRDEVQFAGQVRRTGVVAMLEDCEVPITATRWPRIDFRAQRYAEALGELLQALG